jgi:hypothetical protein
MGRQTGIVATEDDECSLLAFMRSVADIRILVRVARTSEGLWSDEFAPYDGFHTQYYIWNTAFAWEPDIQPVEGHVIVQDAATAPIIEFKRTNVEWLFRPDNTLLVAGSRLYWSRYHMADQLGYDVNRFDKWYSQVIRWVRKHGHRVPEIAGSPYLLPSAWARWQDRGKAEAGDTTDQAAK